MLGPQAFTEALTSERVKAALQGCSRHAEHKGLWQEEQADLMGLRLETFRNWYYGKTPPSLEHFLILAAHFGARFASDVLAPTGLVAVRADDQAMVANIEALKSLRAFVPAAKGLVSDLEKICIPTEEEEHGQD